MSLEPCATTMLYFGLAWGIVHKWACRMFRHPTIYACVFVHRAISFRAARKVVVELVKPRAGAIGNHGRYRLRLNGKIVRVCLT